LKTRIYSFQNVSLNNLTVFFLLLLFSMKTHYAQEVDTLKTEVVNIVKPYSPSISDAIKIKETSLLIDDTNTPKKEVTYSIFSVPVASTFNPAKGKATNLENIIPIPFYDNYAFFGIGNYTNMIAEISSNFETGNSENLSFFFTHRSSQGGIKNIYLDDQFYNSQLELNYTSNQKEINYALNAKFKHQLYNWYGLNNLFDFASPKLINSIDSRQIYYNGKVGGVLQIDDSYLEQVAASFGFTTDRYSSSEFNFKAYPEFSLYTLDIPVKIDMDINFLNGKFSKNYSNIMGIDYGFFNVGILPSYDFNYEQLFLSVGLAGYFSSDLKNSKSRFYAYPKIKGSYRFANEQFVAYAGLEGGLKQNSYDSFKEDNPYLSPTLSIKPTSKLYNGFAGFKGELTNSVIFNVKVSYAKEDDKALLILNDYKGQAVGLEAYEYGNSFTVVYDKLRTVSFFGELIFNLSDIFNIELNSTFYSYDMSKELKAWNLPKFETTIIADIRFNKNIYGGVSLFYVGKRSDLINSSINPLNSEILTLDSYFDLNLKLGYRCNKKLTISIKGANLLGNNYQKWANYKVQGAQGMLGASYKFDW